MMVDPNIMKFTRFEVPQSEESIRKTLQDWIQQPGPDLGVWAAVEQSTGDFLGWFMLRIIDLEVPELGYMIHPRKMNQGFATELADALTEKGLRQLGYSRIVAVTDATNKASVRVLEKCHYQRVPNYQDPHQKKEMWLFEKTK
jgi:RimJ/RimL family protein N-acetyltransferase